jgi:hypothetical protein
MNKENWEYELFFKGTDYAKHNENKGYESFVESRYFQSLHDAFNSLIQTDIRQFDRNTLESDVIPRCYHFAEIKVPGEENPLLRMVQIPINDAPDAQPVAGVYINLEMDIGAFEHQSGFNFANFAAFDPDVPFILLGKYAYGDDGLKIIFDPGFEEMQANIDISQSVGDYGVDWHCKTHIKTSHYEDDLTVQISHNYHKRGALVRDEIFHYTELRDAFKDLLEINMLALNEKTAFDEGLGHCIEEAVILNVRNQQLVALESMTEMKDDERLHENGIYLRFHMPLDNFEKMAGVDLSALDNYRMLAPNQQILQYTADGQELLSTNGYFQLLRSAGFEDAAEIMSRYPTTVPYALQIEWDYSKEESVPELSPVISRREKLFVSLDEAFRSLQDLDDRLFSKDQALQMGHPLYIKYAAVHDTSDNKQIMSKFLVHGADNNLPNGVYIKLNGEKTTVETLHATLQQMPNIDQRGDFHFLVSRPVIDTRQRLQPRQKKVPWNRPGRSI